MSLVLNEAELAQLNTLRAEAHIVGNRGQGKRGQTTIYRRMM